MAQAVNTAVATGTIERAYVRRSVRWAMEWAATDIYGTAEVRDISMYGAFVAVDPYNLLDRGSRVGMRFSNAGKSLHVSGTVRWVGRSSTHNCKGLGVEFDAPAPKLLEWADCELGRSSEEPSGIDAFFTALNSISAAGPRAEAQIIGALHRTLQLIPEVKAISIERQVHGPDGNLESFPSQCGTSGTTYVLDNTATERWTVTVQLKNCTPLTLPLTELAIERARQCLEIHRLEQELALTKERTAKSERLATVGLIAASLAHDIASPLTVIQCNREALKSMLKDWGKQSNPSLTEELTRLIEDDELALEMGVHVVDTIRSWLRGSPVSTAVDVCHVADLLQRMLRNDAEKTGVSIEVQAKGDAVAWAPTGDVFQTLLNLLMNALEAAPRSTTTRVTIERRQERVHVVVENQGSMSPEQRFHVFQPLTTTKQQGCGIGLAACRERVRAFGGELALLDDLTVTKFALILPAAPQA